MITRTSNAPPIAYDQNITIRQDTTVNITLSATDTDGDPLTFALIKTPSSGNLTGILPNLVYKPTSGINGTDNFTFLANDSIENSNVSMVKIIIPMLGDIDMDNDVDNNDINLIVAVRNTPASGPNDLRDINGDMKIDVLDARKVTQLCTRPRCAIK